MLNFLCSSPFPTLMYQLKTRVKHVSQEWTIGARVEISRKNEVAGELAKESFLAGQYQASMDKKVAAVAKKKLGANPAL